MYLQTLMQRTVVAESHLGAHRVRAGPGWDAGLGGRAGRLEQPLRALALESTWEAELSTAILAEDF